MLLEAFKCSRPVSIFIQPTRAEFGVTGSCPPKNTKDGLMGVILIKEGIFGRENIECDTGKPLNLQEKILTFSGS